MAVLGFQLVSTLIAASILSKLSSHFSFGRFLLCTRLYRYLHPTNDALRQVSGGGSNNHRKRGGRAENGHSNSSTSSNDYFTVSKNVLFTLDTAPIEPKDVIQLRYYTDYQWLMDLSFCSLFVVIFNDIFYGIVSTESPRFDLTLIWCVMVVLFATKIMLQLTWMYFSTNETGEMMLIISYGFFCLLLSMGLLLLPEEQLELDLEAAHANFSAAVTQFVYKHHLNDEKNSFGGPISFVTLRLLLAFFAAVTGACFTFPGIRYALMYMDALKAANDSFILRALLHVTFFWPLVVLLTWLAPFRVALHHQFTWLTPQDMYTIRLFAILFHCFLRFVSTSFHLQAYLNLAADRVVKLRREAGRISNLDYQRLIARVFYYLCVVSLQYLAPVLLLLFLTFLYKSHSKLRWDAGRLEHLLPFLDHTSEISNSTSTAADIFSFENWFDSEVRDSVKQWAMGLIQLRTIFTPLFCRGVFGFLVFWIILCNFLTSAFGLIYHTYIIN